MDSLSAILPGINIDDGIIQTPPGSYATSREGVFAGGDVIRGPDTVVAAVSDGMKAADEIIHYLNRQP